MENIPVHTIELGASHDFSIWGHRPEAVLQEVPHRHDYYELILFFEGGGMQAIDFVNHPNHAGTAYFVKTGQVHMMNRSGNSSGCNFRFQRSYFYENETGAAAFFREYPFFSLQAQQSSLKISDDLFAVLVQLVNVYADSVSFASADAQKSMVRTILQLLKTPYEQALTLPSTSGNLQRFMLMISAYFNEKRNVSDYAKMLHITPNYLNELCSDNLGMTAKALIEEQVMLEIKRLLYHTDLSVKEIAHKLNFDDPSYFVRRFKEKTGLTPLAFREQARKG